jgi:hypothetical protein
MPLARGLAWCATPSLGGSHGLLRLASCASEERASWSSIAALQRLRKRSDEYGRREAVGLVRTCADPRSLLKSEGRYSDRCSLARMSVHLCGLSSLPQPCRCAYAQ